MFTVKIVNDTTDGVLLAWAVDIITSNVAPEPFPTGVSILNSDDGGLGGNTFWFATLDTNNANGFGTVDLCAYASNNCTGGSVNQALIELGTDMVVLTFSGDFSGTTTFDIFPSKWQSVGNTGISLGPGGTVEITVPEPSTLALFGIGLAGLGFMTRRRRNRRRQT